MTPTSSARFYSLEVRESVRDPYQDFRTGETQIFQANVAWNYAPKLPTALPFMRYVYDYDVIYNNPKNGESIVVAKGWFGVNLKNDSLIDTLFQPVAMDEELNYRNNAGTFVLPAGSEVTQVELICSQVYDIDYDNRFRGVPSGKKDPEKLRQVYAGYRDALAVQVRFKKLNGDEQIITLTRPECGGFMMPTYAFNHFEKKA